jgi:hypothetical protein
LIKKEQGIDLVEEFRALAPPTEPISIQRWSGRRLRLAIGALAVGVFGLGLAFSEFTGAGVL